MTAEALSTWVDGDGFVCLVTPDTYRGFVGADWELDDILARFVEQMNAGALFVASPGPSGAGAPLTIISDDSAVGAVTGAVREVSGTVFVGDEGLWLTDYTQLTMAAQFNDESPTGRSALRIPVDAGTHLLTLREFAGERPSYTLSVAPTLAAGAYAHGAVPWFD